MQQSKPCAKCRKVIIPINQTYCDICAKLKKKQYHRNRNKEWQHLYGSSWQRARKSFLSQYPLCAECLKNGITKVANVVDHRIPHKGNTNLFWNVGNWNSLCYSCHNKKTAKEGAFGNERTKL
ncbi:MAG: HNH endonuclease [candidate division Zixibacteria bacterium]|nr:HNH endonuclease [candidate division Zixibacteria bacterium]